MLLRLMAPRDNAQAQRLEKSAHENERGYTLIEILVVLTIISLLMALVGPRVLNYLSDSKVKTTRIQIESFSSALDLYFLDTGRYPSTNEGLSALVKKPDSTLSWNGPYLKGSVVPSDPWGRAYVYVSPGEQGPYDIKSLGPDGREGATAISSMKQ
jgi:general secretion pathway protein G